MKKYRILCEFHIISNDYLDATKESLRIDDCPSLLHDKYLILNEKNQEIKYILALLFCDQSHLSYINDSLEESNFVDLILKHDVKIDDFQERDYQLKPVKFLLDKEMIFIDGEGLIKIRLSVLNVCKDLYESNFTRNYGSEIEKEFLQRDYISFYNKLFAPEEANYLNYYLNNSKYGDAKALSNKYRHGNTTLENQEEIYRDYLVGVRMLVLVMIKINDELCFLNPDRTE